AGGVAIGDAIVVAVGLVVVLRGGGALAIGVLRRGPADRGSRSPSWWRRQAHELGRQADADDAKAEAVGSREAAAGAHEGAQLNRPVQREFDAGLDLHQRVGRVDLAVQQIAGARREIPMSPAAAAVLGVAAVAI